MEYILYWIFFSIGDLERLRRFWLTGTCNPKKEEKKASEPLAPEQFLSAFFILLCGILVCVGLMGLEHAYVKYIRRSLVKSDKSWCFGFISLVSSTTIKNGNSSTKWESMLKIETEIYISKSSIFDYLHTLANIV